MQFLVLFALLSLQKVNRNSRCPCVRSLPLKKKQQCFQGSLKNSRNCCLRERSSVFSSQTPRLIIFKTGISLTFLSRECIILSHLKSSFRGTLISPVWRLRSLPTLSSGDLHPAQGTYSLKYHQLMTLTVNIYRALLYHCLFCTDSFNLQECYFSHLTDNWNFG